MIYIYGLSYLARLLYICLAFIYEKFGKKAEKIIEKENFIFLLKVVYYILKLKDNQAYLSLKYD